jgi:hypothetical protein
MLKRCGLTTTALFVERTVRGSCVCQFDMPTRRWSFRHCAEDSNDAFVVVAVAGHRNFVVRRTKFHRVGGVSIIAGSSCRGFQPLPNLAAVNRATSPCKSRVLHVMSSSQHHGCFSSHSFWKAGSARNGSQCGSSLRRAGVIGIRPKA